MKLRELLQAYRKEHGLSQRQFAASCGLSNGYISMIEKNMNPNTGLPLTPSLTALKKVASGMGMSLTELFSLADDMPVEVQVENFESQKASASDAEEKADGSLKHGQNETLFQRVKAFEKIASPDELDAVSGLFDIWYRVAEDFPDAADSATCHKVGTIQHITQLLDAVCTTQNTDILTKLNFVLLYLKEQVQNENSSALGRMLKNITSVENKKSAPEGTET